MDASSLRLCAASTLTCLSLAIPALAIDAPVAADATSRTADGFTANWSEVPGATGYLLDVFKVEGATPTTVEEGFDNLDIDAGVPSGWEFVGCTPNSNNTKVDSQPLPYLILSDAGASATSCWYPAAVTNLHFHAKAGNTVPTLKIEGVNSSGATNTIVETYEFSGTAGIALNFEIAPSLDVRRVIITMQRKSGTSKVNIDGVAVVYNAENLVQVGKDIAAGDATAYTVSGLSPATYRYVVRATDGTDTSADSNAIDVEVTGVSPGYEAPDAPVALPATDVSSTGFTANWEASEGATGYALDIFRDASTTPVRETEGFDDFAYSDGVQSGVPEGWTIANGSSGAATSSGYFKTIPGVRFNSPGDYIQTRAYDEPVTNVTFWTRSSTSTSTITVEGLTSQNSVVAITNNAALPGAGTTGDVNIDRASDIRSIRVTYNRNTGYLAIDNFSVAYGGESIVPVLVGAPVSGTSYTATGLSAGRYEYSVRALNGDASSDPSETISVYVGEAPHVAPVIAPLAAQTVRVGETVTVPLAITQEDGDDITATNVVAAVEPAGAYGIDAGVFTFTPAAEDLGDVSFTFTAESVGGVSAPVTLSVSVKRQRVVAVGMAGTGNRYAQDFDALGTVDCEWDDSAYPLPGWYAQAGTAAPTEIRAGTGSTATSGFYSFGAADDTDRALGTLAGNGKIHRYGVAFTNDTPEIIRQVTVSFTAEQFRVGKDNNATNTLAFAWRVTTAGDMALNSGSAKSWNAVDALSFLTPATADVHGSGAVTGFSKDLSATFGIRLLPGSILLLRWADADDAGNDHAMGIDDLTVTWHHGGGTLFLLR